MTSRSGITKYEYTKKFLEMAGESTTDKNITQHILKFWENTRKFDGGLQLSKSGYTYITHNLDIYSAKIEVKSEVNVNPFSHTVSGTTNILFRMDKYIPCPFYIAKSLLDIQNNQVLLTVQIFDEKTATIMALCGFNLDRYLENQSLKD